MTKSNGAARIAAIIDLHPQFGLVCEALRIETRCDLEESIEVVAAAADLMRVSLNLLQFETLAAAERIVHVTSSTIHRELTS